jgi:hypothetical protein
MFMPSARDFAQAKNDVEELYSAVTQSFSFTTKKPGPIGSAEQSASGTATAVAPTGVSA